MKIRYKLSAEDLLKNNEWHTQEERYCLYDLETPLRLNGNLECLAKHLADCQHPLSVGSVEITHIVNAVRGPMMIRPLDQQEMRCFARLYLNYVVKKHESVL